MMIADLIDKTDFYEGLSALGAPLNPESSLEDWWQSTQAWLAQQGQETHQHFQALLSKWRSDDIILLPEIQDLLNVVEAQEDSKLK